MNILKIKNQKSGGTLALFIKDSYLSVSESVSEKAKLKRGDPPIIALKRIDNSNIRGFLRTYLVLNEQENNA